MQINREDLSEEAEEEELSYWLAFEKLSILGLGLSKLKMLVERFDSLKQAWQAPEYELKRTPGLNELMVSQILNERKDIEPRSLVTRLKAGKIKAFHFYHRLYPPRLREIYDPPAVLY